MTGNSDNRDERCEADADQTWADQIFGLLKQVTDLSVQRLVEDGPPPDVPAAERLARAAGVVARTAKAVLGLKEFGRALAQKRISVTDGEEMSEQNRDFTNAELDGLRSEFFARLDRLVSGLERKEDTAGLDREPAARRSGAGAGPGAAAAAQPEPEPGLAA